MTECVAEQYRCATRIHLVATDGVRLGRPALRRRTVRRRRPRDLGCRARARLHRLDPRPARPARSPRDLQRRGVGVLALDFRGHGRSGGRSTVGRHEIHDVAAAVALAARRTATAVSPCSAGRWAARSVLRHAGLGGDADAVVSVSSPGTLVRARHPADAVGALGVRDPQRPAAVPGRSAAPGSTPAAGTGCRSRRWRSSGDRARAAADRPRRRRPLLPDAARRAAGRGRARRRVLGRAGHGSRRDARPRPS